MDHPPDINIIDAISETEYFRENIENLLKILYPTHNCIKLMVKILLSGPDGSGKRMLARLVAKNLNTKFYEEQVVDLLDDSIVGTEKKIRAALSNYSSLAPCLIYLTGYELFCHLEDSDIDRIEYVISETLNGLLETSTQPIIFIAATNDFERVYKTPLSHSIHYNVSLKSPTCKQAGELIQTIVEKLNISADPIELIDSFSNDNEYYIGNLIHSIAKSEVERFGSSLYAQDTSKNDSHITKEDGTRWLDVGGLGQIKNEILDAIQLPMDYPELKKSGLKRTGILLHGQPGTGKTLLAKAVATECGLNFISVKGPELLNEYVGQSEDNLRRLFQRARDSSPSVIFFDEIDSLAPVRGQAGDSGGVMDRMVSQLMVEMDGVGKSHDVFVIGATNRVDLVDPSLLRPGRFDKVLEVPIPSSRENRLQILQALTRKMKLAEDVDLEKIETLAAPNMSGADFQGLCSRSLQRSFNRCIELVESGQCDEADVEIVTVMQDFVESII